MIEELAFKQVIDSLNRGIILSSIQMAKHTQVCIAKVGFEIKSDDTITLRSLFGYFYTHTNCSPVLVNSENAVILIFNDLKIFQAKALMGKIIYFSKKIFNVRYSSVAMTLIDPYDTLSSLVGRLEKQYTLSRNKQGKICYDTKHFDINKDRKLSFLSDIFQQRNILRIHNLYEGVPIVDKVGIKKFDGHTLVINIDKNRTTFFQNETFCFLEHEWLPNVIKANISMVLTDLNSLVLNKLEIIENSPVERSNIRICPKNRIYTTLFYENKDIARGFIENISENSVALKLNGASFNSFEIDQFNMDGLNISFQIPTPLNFITSIKTKASLFRMDDDLLIVSIFPGETNKKKIRAYILMEQNKLLEELKEKLRS